MQEHFDTLVLALETANQKGAFTLEQSAQSYNALIHLRDAVLAIEDKTKQ
jgi:hypothetical protein